MQASVNTGEAVAALWRLCAIYGSGAIGRETALEYLHETGVVPHDRLRTNYLPLLSQYLLGGTLDSEPVLSSLPLRPVLVPTLHAAPRRPVLAGLTALQDCI